MSALLLMGCASMGPPTNKGEAMQTNDHKLIAIDVLLEPDRTMIGKARAVNAQLRENFPAGYELDALHAPHVTLLQRFVRTKDFDAVTAALAKVLRTADGAAAEGEGSRLCHVGRTSRHSHHRRAHA